MLSSLPRGSVWVYFPCRHWILLCCLF